MDITRALEYVMHKEHITQSKLAKELGVSKQRVNQALRQEDMLTGIAAEMLKACGYRLVVVREDEEHNGLEIG